MTTTKPRVYFYTDAEVGVPWPGPDADFIVNGKPKDPTVAWPRFNWCAFSGFEETTNPDVADIFVVRQRLVWLTENQIHGLPHMCQDNMKRHVFFDLGPDGGEPCFRAFPDIPAIFFRAAVNKMMMEGTPTTVPWAWPTDDFSKYPLVPDGGFKYDVIFQGQTVRERDNSQIVVDRLKNVSGLTKHLVVTPHFYGLMRDGRDRWALRESFIDTLHYGRLSLVPGCHRYGVTRYRFYETLSMGRIPVYIDDRGGVLPFADKIDYSNCCIFVKEKDVPQIATILQTWLDAHSDQEILAMGAYGRKMWKHYLNRASWAQRIEEVVREKLGL